MSEQQQWGAAPAEPKKKRHIFRNTLIAFVGVIAVITAISAVSGGESTSPSAGTAQGDEEVTEDTQEAQELADDTPAKVAGMGTVVRDGKFSFKVTKVKTGVKSVGGEYLNKDAQGQFVLVSMTVTNKGDKPQTFDGDAQELFDAKGRKFSSDSEAGIYLDDTNSFYTEINPGNSVKGIVVYDIPKTAKPTTIELHDSVFSGGTSVSLK